MAQNWTDLRSAVGFLDFLLGYEHRHMESGLLDLNEPLDVALAIVRERRKQVLPSYKV